MTIPPDAITLTSADQQRLIAIRAIAGDPYEHTVSRALYLYDRVIRANRPSDWISVGPAVIQVWTRRQFIRRGWPTIVVAVVMAAVGMLIGWTAR